MGPMRKQPDFSSMFFEYFGSCPRPLSYALRFDSSLLHDLQFMSSLIHDAAFLPESLAITRKRVVLRMRRECWELPKVKIGAAVHLAVVESELVISPSTEITWCLAGEYLGQSPQGGLTLRGLHVDLDYWNPERSFFTLALQGHSWLCHIRVDSKSPLVRLRDVGLPKMIDCDVDLL
jgi:hypothetical protein